MILRRKCSCIKFRHLQCGCKVISVGTQFGIKYTLDTNRTKHNHEDERLLLRACAAYDGMTHCAELNVSFTMWCRS